MQSNNDFYNAFLLSSVVFLFLLSTRSNCYNFYSEKARYIEGISKKYYVPSFNDRKKQINQQVNIQTVQGNKIIGRHLPVKVGLQRYEDNFL
jgi:hypothetical protein